MNRDELIEVIARAIRPDLVCSNKLLEALKRDSLQRANAALQSIQHAGYAVVPVEPTHAMIDAQFMAYNSMDNILLSDWDKAKEMYKAMLDAAK